MKGAVWDDRPCGLGEGPLWHPGRGQLYWFDITGRRLLTRGADGPACWDFAEMVSAAGWLSDDALLIASETALFRFDLESGAREDLVPLEAGNPVTRSNDGRADPWGGFWIGTMGKSAEDGAGAIYRYWKGELRRLFAPLTIPNAICFAPEAPLAHFTDTPTQIVHRVALDPATGWPAAGPEPWLDLSGTPWRPDGAVIDAAGTFWNAQWGGYRVAAYGMDGAPAGAVSFPGAHTSCPAFGGDGLDTLFCTSAREDLTAEQIEEHPEHGMTFAAEGVARGQAEHRVILG